ncbi:hypothetical protein PCASD_10180 [Puccinia coronata f. sp. avenae]|uniref:Uncharacterized protein n=1 Tax=Puccinia coronata f. sp. avenae TaxID=200324 RepID=A0A2N5UGN8_9BASI|nr:hypothetical protein PCASD_10180 [Puccinia coronata f. sp. avenae]
MRGISLVFFCRRWSDKMFCQTFVGGLTTRTRRADLPSAVHPCHRLWPKQQRLVGYLDIVDLLFIHNTCKMEPTVIFYKCM